MCVSKEEDYWIPLGRVLRCPPFFFGEGEMSIIAPILSHAVAAYIENMNTYDVSIVGLDKRIITERNVKAPTPGDALDTVLKQYEGFTYTQYAVLLKTVVPIKLEAA